MVTLRSYVHVCIGVPHFQIFSSFRHIGNLQDKVPHYRGKQSEDKCLNYGYCLVLIFLSMVLLHEGIIHVHI